MTRRDELLDYYARRAREYDRIYERPERRDDLARLVQLVRDWTAGRRVLELACGTGWWTHRIAGVASCVVATDAVEDVLDVARSRAYPEGTVEFRRADAFDPRPVAGDFDTAMAGFWISHLRRSGAPDFLDTLHDRMPPGSRIILFDNRFVAGSSTPIARQDDLGDTFQRRRLADGSEHEVLKNFFTAGEIRHLLRGRACDVQYHELKYYWAVAYEVET